MKNARPGGIGTTALLCFAGGVLMLSIGGAVAQNAAGTGGSAGNTGGQSPAKSVNGGSGSIVGAGSGSSGGSPGSTIVDPANGGVAGTGMGTTTGTKSGGAAGTGMSVRGPAGQGINNGTDTNMGTTNSGNAPVK